MSDKVSGNASSVPRTTVQLEVGAAPQLIDNASGNLYAFLAENNDAADVFLRFYDAADAGDVTVGTTPHEFAHKIAAGSAFGRDPVNLPYHYFNLGLVIAVTTTRTGSTNPAATSSVKVWYQRAN